MTQPIIPRERGREGCVHVHEAIPVQQLEILIEKLDVSHAISCHNTPAGITEIQLCGRGKGACPHWLMVVMAVTGESCSFISLTGFFLSRDNSLTGLISSKNTNTCTCTL